MNVTDQRVVAARDFTATVDFSVEEDEVPGAVSCSLADSQGTVVAGSGPATAGAAGVFTFDVPAAAVPLVDVLSAVWVSDIGTVVTTIDVRARRLFTVPQLVAAFPEVEARPAGVLEAERTAAEDFLEDQCGRSFAGQFSVASFLADSGGGPLRARPVRCRLILPHYPVTAVRYLSVDGVALTVDELAGVVVDPDGFVSYAPGLGGVVTVGYEHGQPVTDVARVAMILARHRIVNGPLDSRAIGLPVEGGGVISLLTPGVRGSVTGIPEVDQFLQSHQGRDRGVA